MKDLIFIMTNRNNIMIEWIYQNYKVIAGVIVAIIGLFKSAPLIKKKLTNKENKNNQLQAKGNIDNYQALNQNTLNAASNSTQNLVNGNQTLNLIADIKGIEITARGFICTMFPQTERAFNKLRLNAFEFLGLLETELKKLSKEELEKFSEPDVQIVLQSAIKSAARKNLPETSQILVKLIVDRVQKPKCSLAELAINESIEVISKLDFNLIKILSLCFMFFKTKGMGLKNEEKLFEVLSSIVNKFEDIDASISKFEYLEGISCGKLLPGTNSNNLIDIISRNYQHLFIKEIPVKQVANLSLPHHIEFLCFEKFDSAHLKLNSVIGLHLFEGQELFPNKNIPLRFDEAIKNMLKQICISNKLPRNEIESLLCEKVQGFKHLIDIWNKNGFAHFSLTAVGIAIGRVYSEQTGFGSFDINTWIK